MDNSNPESPGTNKTPVQPQPPTQQPQQPQQPVNDTGASGPGQIISASGAAMPPPTAQPQPANQLQSDPSQPISGNFAPEPDYPRPSRKKWILFAAISTVILAVVVVAIVFFLNSENKNDNGTPQSSPSASSSDETASWQTYSDKLITLKYPSGWQIKPLKDWGEGNFVIQPAGTNGETGKSCYFGEDNYTDNAKSNNAKKYWRVAYGSGGKIVKERLDQINSYDAYSVKVKATDPSITDPSIDDSYIVVSKNKTKVAFNYTSSDQNKDTYEKIIKTIHIN